MLVEFSVGNYRSFRKTQTLSMVASTSVGGLPGNQFETGFRVAPELLQSTCILGPNASGKSNLVRAMDFCCDFAVDSVKDLQEGDKIDVEPFKLASDTISEPSEFEISFIVDTVLFRYGLSVDRKRVHGEWLYARSSEEGSRERLLFTREFDQDSQSYDWKINDREIRGEREKWKAATRTNATFLSTAVQGNAADLKPPFIWFKENFHAVTSTTELGPGYTLSRMENPDEKAKILKLIQDVDLSISDIHVEEKDIETLEFPKDMPDEIRSELIKELGGGKILDTHFAHVDEKGEPTYFRLRDESDGTRAIFTLAGPWLDSLENGYTVVVDELNNSLHPGALRYLVELFHNSDLNNKNAQLIFTTHGTSILSRQTMQRDQVWFMERNEDQSTHLFPLTDFKPRKDEAIEKGYLGGRYGALPNIRGFY